jgi:antitoxin component YwqK of YwqJK toxin-antitoxin module
MAFMARLERLVAKTTVALAVLICGCGTTMEQQPVKELKWYDETSLQLQIENGIYKNNSLLFTGVVYSLALNRKDTLAVGSIVDGKEHGEWRKYFSNRQLMERRYYTEGKKTGLFEAWWRDGKKRLVYHFQNGEYEGGCRDWSESGVLVSDMNFHEGHEKGEQKQYYEDGKVKANYVIIDGRRFGLLGTKNCVNVSDSVGLKI